MGVLGDRIRQCIGANIHDARIDVRDTTGGGDHFEVYVVATAFAGKGLVDRHRMVYAALGDLMKGPVHALALNTVTPEEEATRRQP